MQPPSDPQACAPLPTEPPHASAWPALLLRALSLSGYGLWMLLGMALGLGVYRGGRSEALLPLALGGLFVSAGLLAAALRLPGLTLWHGWRPARGGRPTREALLALATYLPMLAVGGLVRGGNTFWATRLAGAGLALCSLATLVFAVHSYRYRLGADGLRRTAPLPISRVVGAWYAGGLWLWLCLSVQDSTTPPAADRPWIMVLLMLAVVLGLIEGLRWQALQPAAAAEGRMPAGRGARFVAAILTYAVPSVVVLRIDLSGAGVLLIGIAAISCLLGRALEQGAYEAALLQPSAAATG